MGFLVLLGRILFSAIFLMSGMGHLTQSESMGQYAGSKGVPAPRIMVILTGIMIVLGGFSVLLGMYVNIGALLLVLFLIPAALYMHDFWNIEDPQESQNEQIHFMKNMSMAGAALLIWYLWRVTEVPFTVL